MTFNQSILFSFLLIIAVTIFSAFLLKIYRTRKAKSGVRENQGPKKIDIELKGDIFELDKLAIILDDLARYDVPVKTILNLNVILEEVYTGIISRRKEGQQSIKVLITLILELSQITAIIKDSNDEFDPTVIKKIDLNAPIEEISVQGLGFHMVMHLADHLSYQRLDGQNILTIRKNSATG